MTFDMSADELVTIKIYSKNNCAGLPSVFVFKRGQIRCRRRDFCNNEFYSGNIVVIN